MGAFRDVIIGPPGAADEVAARLRVPPRWPVLWWAVLIVSAGLSAFLIGWGVSLLPGAHLARQRTGEGLQFGAVMLLYMAGHMVLLPVAFVISRMRAGASTSMGRQAWLGLGVAIIGLLVVVDALAVWVEWHGDRCIGACG